MSKKEYHCDFGNICEMFKETIKRILIANQENNPYKISSICLDTTKKLEKLQNREK